MAHLDQFKSRNTHRIRYTLSLRGRQKTRAKYVRDRVEADQLKVRLEEIERATRTGIARQEDIGEWIDRGWIMQDEAEIAFTGFAESTDRRRHLDGKPTDYDAIEDAYADHATANTKGGGGSTRNIQNSMSHARVGLEWLRSHFPDLSQLTVKDCERFRRDLQALTSAPWTIYHRMTKLRLLLDQAIELQMITTNPAREITLEQPKRLKQRRILSLAEVQWVLDTSLLYRQWIHGSLPTVARMGLYAGLRDIEMTWCTWDWIDWDQRILHVVETRCQQTGERWTPKSHEKRALDVKPELIHYLVEERQRQKESDLLNQFILPAGNRYQADYIGRPLSQDAPQKAWHKMMSTAAELDQPGLDITIYSLRHTYCTTLLRPPPNGAGLDIRTVQRRMGHSDIRTTEQYLRDIEPEKHPTDALPY